MKNVVIYGFGGFATGDLTWLLDEINETLAEEERWNLLGFLDDEKGNIGEKKNGFEVLGDERWLDSHCRQVYCIIGLGNGKIREQIFLRIREKVLGFPTLIHPNARISQYTQIGDGTIVSPGVLISGNTEIGRNVVLNLACTIGHDVILHDFSTVAPGAHLSGHVTVGKHSDIGTGASVIQGRCVGEGCIIGANAAVIRDVPDHCTAVGVPARILSAK